MYDNNANALTSAEYIGKFRTHCSFSCCLMLVVVVLLLKSRRNTEKHTILMSLLVLLLIAALRPICLCRKLNRTENWSAGIVYDVMNKMTSCLLLAPIHRTRDFNKSKILEKSIHNKCLLWCAGTFYFLSTIEENKMAFIFTCLTQNFPDHRHSHCDTFFISVNEKQQI